MKGPGLRIDLDVRRAWRCPTCGQNLRLPLDATAPRCHCVRDGVPMKLAEGLRPGRHDLRADVRSLIDRLLAGEEIPRLVSLVTGEADGGLAAGARPRGRPPRPERSREYTQTPTRETLPPEPRDLVADKPAPQPAPAPPVPTPPAADDDFGAGLGTGDPPAAQ